MEVGKHRAFSGKHASPVKAQGIEREWERGWKCVGPDGTGLECHAKEPQLYIVGKGEFQKAMSYSELPMEEGNLIKGKN